MAAGTTTESLLPALGLLEALTARRQEHPAQGKVMPNLPLASQSNASRGSGLLGRAASLLSGSNPSTIGMAAECSTDRWQHARPQPEKQSDERAVVSVLLIACSCPDYLAGLKKILPGLLATHHLFSLLSV